MRLLLEAQAASDDTEVTRINSVFHRCVVACADSIVLAQLLDSLTERVRFHFSAAAHTRGKETVEEHAELVAAMRDKDREAAARLIEKHIAATRSAVADRLGLEAG